jgi:hypothetical protein
MDVSSQLDKTRRLDNGTAVTFKYTETFENHFLYRHAVDDHNNRHSDIFIEESYSRSPKLTLGRPSGTSFGLHPRNDAR